MYDQRPSAETGALLDRAGCMETIAECVNRQIHESQYEFAVILLDCDNFKIINESLGHYVGDQFLAELARRLQAVVSDSGRLAHLGGDEFAIIIDKVGGLRYALAIAERINQELRTPITLGEQRLFVSVSQGITTSDTDYHDAIEVLRDADSALHYAKRLGYGRFAVFTNEMRLQAVRRLTLSTDLRLALARDELCLYYQPIFNLESGNIAAFEALLRWQHPQLGLIAPNEFLAIATEIGLLSRIDHWVLVSACRQVQQWRSIGAAAAHCSVNVNMSGRLLAEPELVAFVQSTLAACGLPPQALSLEITEETVITQGDTALLTLNQLRALGVKICLDDFGTHYSSLSYLHHLPITTLKLDRSFLRGIELSRRGVHVISAVTNLAHALGIQVVGEGVEQEAHLELLRNLQCDYGQGYFLARPQSVAAIAQLIAYPVQAVQTPEATTLADASLCIRMPAIQSAFVQRDPLTGLLSRSMLATALEQVLCRHQYLEQQFALMVLDLDFFKSVNDAFGHARGDQILVELSRRVTATLGSEDLVFRYGGDELVLLCPQSDRNEAAALATQVIARIAAQPFPGEPPLTLSGSIGVALYPDDGLTAEVLFEKADQRNYQAKRSGRGRAIWEDNAVPSAPTLEGPSRLIERDQALQIAQRFLDEWPHAPLGVLKIAAAPQVGASRFLAEIEQAARLRGQVVLHLRGTAALKERAYGMFLELREIWPDLPLPSLQPAAFARALHEHLVRNRNDRLLVLVDNLATADQASIELLQALMSLSDLGRIGLVYATPRTNYDLDLPRQNVLYAELQLEALSVMGLRTWLRHSLNWEAPQPFLVWLHQQTQGKPALIRDGLAYLLQQEILRHSNGRWHYWSDIQTLSLHTKLEQLAVRATQTLPRNAGLFIGREIEIPRLKKVMRQHRLIQVIGPGGVGKSRLAVQAAAEMGHVFADGICYVQLNALDHREFLTYAIAEALGLSLTGARSPAEQLYVHLASRQMLLLLDNMSNNSIDLRCCVRSRRVRHRCKCC
ncbi:MAG: EAL domain-containing protein [Oscillochloris sp.]|nr:EAL domain-containing protein [Oscillochloris sp.]